MRLDFPFPHVATGNLDVPVIGQLPAANLPLGDEFKPNAMKVVGFEAALRGWALWKQYLENTTRNTHHAFIFADSYAELNDGAVGIPASVSGKRKNMALLECSVNVLRNIPQAHLGVEVFVSGVRNYRDLYCRQTTTAVSTARR